MAAEERPFFLKKHKGYGRHTSSQKMTWGVAAMVTVHWFMVSPFLFHIIIEGKYHKERKECTMNAGFSS